MGDRGWAAAAFFIPLLICLVVLALDSVWPLGDKCILHVDMYHQYCPFFTEFMNKLKSGESLMYSWKVGLGSDFWAIYVYYLSSPLNWLLLLCPAKHVIEFMTILILVKISFAGYSFWKFCSYHFGRHKGATTLVFSTAYALSGFVAAYSWDIMWMDCIALAPLIFIGLEKLMLEGKPAMYYITLALSIICNYYMSIMICIFLVFYFVLLFFEMGGDAEHRRWKGTGRFTVYSLLAGGTGIFLMLPEMIVLSSSGSSGIKFPSSVEWYFDMFSEVVRMSTDAAAYTSSKHWPNLYAGAFTIFLVFLYLLNQEIPWKKKLPRFGMVIFFLLSFANNWLDFIWHGFHFPDSLPGRQSFLFAFLVLVMAYEVCLHKNAIRKLEIIVAFAAAEVLFAVGLYKADTEITDRTAIIMTMVFMAFYALGMMLELLWQEEALLVRCLIIGVAFLELSYNMFDTGFHTTSRTTYMAKTDAYDTLLDAAEADAENQAGVDSSDQVFFRVEDTERYCKNDDARFGYASATQFSSLMNINVSHFYQKLYMEGGKNFYCYNGSTPLTSAMLSVGYFLSDSPNEESDLKTLVAEEDGYYLYRNNYCLPMGYVIPEDMAEEWEAYTGQKLSAVNSLASILGADSDLLSEACYEQEVEDGSTTITFQEDGYYYGAYVDCDSDYLTFSYSNGTKTTWSKTSHSYLFDLGYDKKGESVTITNRSSESIRFIVYKLNMEALDQAYSTLNAETFDLDSYSSTRIDGSITTADGGRLVFPIADEEGWTLYVDGKETEIQSFSDTFISVLLDAGEHEISLKYETPGLKKGLLASGVCVLIFIALMVFRMMKKSRKAPAEEIPAEEPAEMEDAKTSAEKSAEMAVAKIPEHESAKIAEKKS